MEAPSKEGTERDRVGSHKWVTDLEGLLVVGHGSLQVARAALRLVALLLHVRHLRVSHRGHDTEDTSKADGEVHNKERHRGAE